MQLAVVKKSEPHGNNRKQKCTQTRQQKRDESRDFV